MKARTGVQMLSKIVVAKLATVKDVFLTSVKVVITLIPPVLLVSKAGNGILPLTGKTTIASLGLRTIVKAAKETLQKSLYRRMSASSVIKLNECWLFCEFSQTLHLPYFNL